MLCECLLTSWLSLSITSRNAVDNQDADFSRIVCQKVLADYYLIIYTHSQELMKTVGSDGS